MVRLEVLENRKMRWQSGLHKDYFGTRNDRHRLGRFIMKNTCRLPVTVLVEKLWHIFDFSFTPIVLNKHARNVAFHYRCYLIIISFNDVAQWLKLLINSHNLYENERCRHIDVWLLYHIIKWACNLFPNCTSSIQERIKLVQISINRINSYKASEAPIWLYTY